MMTTPSRPVIDALTVDETLLLSGYPPEVVCSLIYAVGGYPTMGTVLEALKAMGKPFTRSNIYNVAKEVIVCDSIQA